MTSNLSSQMTAATAVQNSLQDLMQETIRVQYFSLPPRYLVMVDSQLGQELFPSSITDDGVDNDDRARRVTPNDTQPKSKRQIVTHALQIFCFIKRRNLLLLAVGIWKICLVKAANIIRSKEYSRTAAILLFKNWFIKKTYKKTKIWYYQWIDKTSRLIFHERNRGVLPLQCLYRRWRDRRFFIRMHLVAPYNGPLSDIYLGPNRPTAKFCIPSMIRNTRRMLWQAAVLIQTQYRRFDVMKEHMKKVRHAIRIQSKLRMLPKRIQYRRLKRFTIKAQSWVRRKIVIVCFRLLKKVSIIVQKYVRRYQAINLKFRMLDAKWTSIERPMWNVIVIQCKWRIYLAKRKTDNIRLNQKFQQFAALVVQRNWYRLKKAFHTFLLMCCYRAREEEDNIFDKFVKAKRRYYSARKIQRLYKMHYFKRMISSCVKVQCWYRSRMGYSSVTILRKIKWAARKLHHWARGMMRWKHKCARLIQKNWWRAKRGRLMRHLDYKAKVKDLADDALVAKNYRHAASKITAVIKGVYARAWVRRHKAAIVIQKQAKQFVRIRKWKRIVRERSKKFVIKVVSKIISHGLMKVTNLIYRQHSKLLIKPQAVCRGYIIRYIIGRAKKKALQYAMAVITIQRFWRNSGAFLKAVQEVLALKRLWGNIFKSVDSVHELLLNMTESSKSFFVVTDPRAGILTSTFLQRFGFRDLSPLFPIKLYKYASDLRLLSIKKMESLYDSYQNKLLERQTVE